jgi:hypothetical protein
LRSIGTTKEFGVPESIDDREAPRPGAGEIVVAIQAAGPTLNYFQMKYKWEAAPTTNPGTWSFQASN